MATLPKRKATVDSKDFYETGCVKIRLTYFVEALSLFMRFNYNSQNQITTITHIKLSHSYFTANVINIQSQTLSPKSSLYYANFVLTNKKDTVYIHRKTQIQLKTTLNKETHKYSLSVKFIKAPSLFHDKTFTVHDIIDQQSTLKQSVYSAISNSCDKHCPPQVLSIIFQQYLSLFFWSHAEPFIYHSLRLNINDIIIPKQYKSLDSGLLGLNHRLCHDHEISEILIGGNDFDLITEVNYVTYNDIHNMQKCCINGLSVQAKINDKTINDSKYAELHRILNYYNLFYPDFGAIWSLKNPSMLFDLKNLLRGIEMFSMDKKEHIAISAQLLIDKNVSVDDVAMLWIKWKPMEQDVSDSDDDDNDDGCELNDDTFILKNVWTMKRWDRECAITCAEIFCHTDFDLCLKYYGIAIKECSVDEILDMMNNGKQHFGEPLIALKNSINLTEDEIRAIEILGIDNKEYKNRCVRQLKYQENMRFVEISEKKRKYRMRYPHKEIKVSKNMRRCKHTNKWKKSLYHRW